MIAHLHAIRDALGSLTFTRPGTAGPVPVPVHFGGVEGDPGTVPTPPYLIVWSNAGEGTPERVMAGALGHMTSDVRVTCVAGTEEGATILAASVRETLTPGFDPAPLTVEGRYVTVAHDGSMSPQIDRDVRITGTNTHPAFGVELFQIDSQPL